MKTVMHFIGSLETGGTENMLLAYLRNTNAKGLRQVVCTVFPGGALESEFRMWKPQSGLSHSAECEHARRISGDINSWNPGDSNKSNIEVISLGFRSKWAALLLAKLAFTSILMKTKPDVVHSYLLRENLLARVIGKLMGKKVICGKRDTDRGKAFWKVWLDRLTLPLADLNISNSMAGVNELKSYGVPENKIMFIPNGKEVPPPITKAARTAARAKLGFNETDVLLGCVARLYKFKGHEFLLRAMPTILKAEPNAKLVLVGDGEMRGQLEALTKELDIADKVVFLGERSNGMSRSTEREHVRRNSGDKDVAEALRAFDIFVFPSLREGMPGALMEAMAAGLPVVATDIDGNRELVRHGIDGLLVPPHDFKELALSVIELLLDKKRAQKFGTAARERIGKDFGIEKMVHSLDEVYLKF
jgi:glycosyltransferase involved in cell wall biosynthesis